MKFMRDQKGYRCFIYLPLPHQPISQFFGSQVLLITMQGSQLWLTK